MKLRRCLMTTAMTALAVVLAPAGGALAAKSPPTPPSVALNTAALERGSPYLGGSVSFVVSYPREVKSPRIAVSCVNAEGANYAEAGSYDASFVLGGASSDWQRAGGDADCTADLFYFSWKPNQLQQYHWLASTDFRATG